MDKVNDTTNSRNTIKTDLSLLLECLKSQMKCPDLQKQALLAIHSICENREDNVDILRQMGGVVFLHNLSKSSCVHSDVKETALFTLGTLAEANVYCKNSLCRKETFSDLAGWLMKEDVPLTQKRVSVYLMSVLVANNKSGQTLAQTTGCLDVLLDLFRTTFPLSTEATLRAVNATQIYQLWASVCGALCGCVNNPQNEEGQRICVAAFPLIKTWLQQIALSRVEVFQSICSFIATTVSNNSAVQESFSVSGGLESLTLALVHLATAADSSLLSCQLSVTISKTLSACITDNLTLASGLAQYGVVSHLFFLLVSPHLDPEDRLSLLLTMGHCTAASEEHQSQLVQCGGLPLIITFLAEDANEEVRKAATFILQTCKQATMSLGVPGFITRQGEGENLKAHTNLKRFKQSARELLNRIDLLERRQAKAEDDLEDTDPATSSKGPIQPSLPSALPLSLQQRQDIKMTLAAHRKTSTPKHVKAKTDYNTECHTTRNVIKNDSEWRNMSSILSMQWEKPKTIRGDVWCPACKGTGALITSNLRPLEGGKANGSSDSLPFKLPAAVKNSVPKESKKDKNVEEGVQDSKTSNTGTSILKKHSGSQIRCAGCVLPFEEVTSRTFSFLQSSCRHSCDMHRVLQEASEQFRTSQCKLLSNREDKGNSKEQANQISDEVSEVEPQRGWRTWSEVCLTPKHKTAGKGKSFLPGHNCQQHNGIILTPLRKEATKGSMTSHNKPGPSLTSLKKPHHPTERREGDNSRLPAIDEMKTHADHISTRRKRKDFTSEEIHYLLSGVKTLGYSWNSILWSYPFQPGRTNVDLAMKHRRLMKAGAADVDSSSS